MKLIELDTGLVIDKYWYELLSKQFGSEYFKRVLNALKMECDNQVVFPSKEDIFNAFNNCSLSKLKVVIIGQDPYHGLGQANGSSFSVNKGMRIPPSLRNIYKELHSDLGIFPPAHGDLSSWSSEGVLLLNSVLTVREKEPASHKNIGWEKFTDSVISKLSEQKNNLVFILWGAFAQSKEKLIFDNKHLVIKSTHPSPFSAHKGFLGSRPFSKTNNFLISKGKKPINWEIAS